MAVSIYRHFNIMQKICTLQHIFSMAIYLSSRKRIAKEIYSNKNYHIDPYYPFYEWWGLFHIYIRKRQYLHNILWRKHQETYPWLLTTFKEKTAFPKIILPYSTFAFFYSLTILFETEFKNKSIKENLNSFWFYHKVYRYNFTTLHYALFLSYVKR